MPWSSISTLVLITRLLVIRLLASPVVPESSELSSSILSMIASPSLICGVIFRMVPTSWRCTVVNGLTVPLLVLVLLVY